MRGDTPPESLRLRSGFVILNRERGTYPWTFRVTRRTCIKDYVKWCGVGDWKHRQKMGDVCIRAAIYAEAPV